MNTKRNRKPRQNLGATESSSAEGESPLKKRLRSGRKPETLQSFWAQRLQPWIDLVNLLPFQSAGDEWRLSERQPQALAEAFVREFGQREATHPFRLFVKRVMGWRAQRPRPTMELLNLFDVALKVFERLQSMMWPSPTTEADGAPEVAHWAAEAFEMTYSIADLGDGRVKFSPDPDRERFKKALEGVEIARIRRCPFCGKFFYAIRDNKGACNEHLARARVERGRNPELRAKYEEARRFRKRIGTKKAIRRCEARALDSLNEALRFPEEEQN